MSAPNIVAICLDDLMPDWERFMPSFVAGMGLDWRVFPNSVNTAPVCGPSRMSIFTGQYARRTGSANNQHTNLYVDGGVDPERMVAAALQRTGVHTRLVGKYNNGYPWFSLTGDSTYEPAGWSSSHIFKTNIAFYNYGVVDNGVQTDYGEAEADYRTDQEGARLASAMTDMPEPFFLYYAPGAPHKQTTDVYPPAPRHADLYDGEAPVLRPNHNEADISDKPTWLRNLRPNQYSQANLDQFAANYMDAGRMLAAVEENIQTIVDGLVTRGIDDNTYIFFWADNSNLFGEHRWADKSVPWQESIHMALRVAGPGVAAGIDPALVGNIDLAPTWCDIAGSVLADAPDGMSLLPLLHGTLDADSWRQHLIVQRDQEDPPQFASPGFTALLERTPSSFRKYVEWEDGTGDVEQYDLDGDPYELVNLGPDAVLAARLAALQAQQIPAQ